MSYVYKNRIFILPFILLLIVFLAMASPALGNPDPDTVFCYASGDAHVHSAAPNGNFGSNAFLRAGYCCGEFPGKTFTYIKFDLSSIPAGSTVNGATLGLYLDSGMGFSSGMGLIASRVTSGWDEGSITWNNKPGGSTTFDNTSVGTSPGWY